MLARTNPKGFLLGIACLGLALLDVLRGESSLVGVLGWWVGSRLQLGRSDSPSMFWFCVSTELLLALVCFLFAFMDRLFDASSGSD